MFDEDIGNDEDDDDEEADIENKPPSKPPSTKKSHVGSTDKRIEERPGLTWEPLYSIALWKCGAMESKVSMAIVLPSSVDPKDEVKIFVSDNQRELAVHVKWPRMISNVDALHHFWNKKNKDALPEFHPKIIAFHDFYSALRKREDDVLYSVAHILLPIQVQKNVEAIYHLGDEYGTRILYVDLKGFQDSGYKGNRSDKLLIVKYE